MSDLLLKLQKVNAAIQDFHLEQFLFWKDNIAVLDNNLKQVFLGSNRANETEAQALKRLGALDILLTVKYNVEGVRSAMQVINAPEKDSKEKVNV